MKDQRMKLRTGRLVAVLMTTVLLLTVTVAATALDARVTSVTGKVELRIPGEAWRPVEVGTIVPVQATLSTGFNSQAELEVGPAILQVRPLTRLSIEELIAQEDSVESELNLQVGRIRAELRTTEGVRSEFRVRSPIATAAVRGTSFEFDGVNIQVDTGSVQLANQFNETVAVGGGESSSADTDEPPTTPAEAREAASTVQPFVAAGDAARSEGVRTSTTSGAYGNIRVDWTIVEIWTWY